MRFIVSLCSAIIWGSGQLINKQKLKALGFFIIQCILIFVELFTGTFNVITGSVDRTFRNCGFFIKGIWGLVTLGTIPRTDSSVLIYDHSVMLMISGLVALVILLAFILVWIWNIRDAYKSRVEIEKGEKISSIEYMENLWNNAFEYIMITPGMIAVIFISIIPIIFSVLVAFTNYNLNNIPPKNLVSWIGFKTFSDVLATPIWGPTFVSVFIWTVIWAFGAGFLTYGFGLLQAILINAKGIRFKKMWRGIYMLAWAVPALVSQLTFKAMFNTDGAFNQLLIGAGIIHKAIPFLSNVGWARAVLFMVTTWLGFPSFMALISGVMTTISPELYEAAEVDGANGWYKFRYISLPMILTATAPQIILNVTFNFNNFGMIYFVTGGGPANPAFKLAGSTDILISWIFKLTLNQRMYNYAAAISILIFIILATVNGLTLLRTRVFRED